MSALKEAALAYARAGRMIFPCVPGEKRPATPEGFHNASRDVAQVEAWWTENPEYNIAFEPETEGLCVIDTDGGEGANNLAGLELETANLPETRTISTPNNGRHLYFRGSLPSSASKLAPKVDTRGVGSYVLLPPSVVNGRPYKVDCAVDPSPLPAWVSSRFTATVRATAAADVELDAPQNVARAKDYLARAPIAISGEGGNTTTYNVAAALKELGLSFDTASEMMDVAWNPRCSPPWDRQDLEVIVENAYTYAQNEAGASAVGSLKDTFASQIASVVQEEQAKPRSGRFKLHDADDIDQFPEPKWLVDNLIQDGSHNLLFGGFGSYKSFAAVDIACSVAADVPAFGSLAVNRTGPVVLLLGEGAGGVGRLRIPAWKRAREAQPKGLFVVKAMPQVANPAEVEELLTEIGELKPVLIVCDTLSRAMVGLNENDTGDMGQYLVFADGLCRMFGCAVLTIAHTGKDEGKGSRGSTALPAGVDAAWQISADRDEMTARIEPYKLKDAENPEPHEIHGKEAGGSIVFNAQRAAPKLKLKSKPGPRGLSPAHIGAALLAAGALEANDRSLNTRQLAVTLCQPSDDTNLIANKVKAINRLASSGLLKSYAKDVGVWHYPILSEPPSDVPEPSVGDEP